MNMISTNNYTKPDNWYELPQRILIVDDEPRMRSSLKLLINNKNRDILECESGAEAFKILKTEKIDLILLDINLQDISGLEILDWITHNKIPTNVIMVSAVDSIDYAILAMRRGAIDFVRKPDELDQITHKVDNALYRRCLEQSHSLITKHLEHSERLHRFLVENSPDLIYTLNSDCCFVFINARIESLLGFTKEELIGAHYSSIIHEDDRELAFHTFNQCHVGNVSNNSEIRLKCKSGLNNSQENRNVVAMVCSIGIYNENIKDGHLVRQSFSGVYCVARDITDRKLSEDIITFQALHDQLTLLPNRRLYYDHLELAMSNSKRQGSYVGVMFIDLDRFKLVNDTYGHSQGDELLKSVAQRLRQCVRAGDTLARQGGDEFTVVLPGLIQVEDAAVIANKILSNLKLPFNVAGQEFRATASIGIAIFPRDGDSADMLMKSADIAMYKVKANGKNGFQYFATEMNACYHERISLENELRQAIQNSEFELYYQPKFDIIKNCIVGMEALLRWNHPIHGVLNPGGFLDIAEETGLVSAITDWVLEEACSRLARWQFLGLKISISINISPKEFDREDLDELIIETTKKYQISDNLLEIEITENMMLSNVSGILAKMRRLREHGIRISIDDFGTGYSSLNYLRQFPIDCIKIDQSFVRDLVSGTEVSPIIHAIIGIARGFGLHIVVEGVETDYQKEILKEIGCYEMQGYLFSRPVPALYAENMLGISHRNSSMTHEQALPFTKKNFAVDGQQHLMLHVA